MEVLKDLYNTYFGKNEGIELIAERLRGGKPYVKVYDRKENAMIYFKGTGEYIRGTGVHRVYDVHFQCVYPTGHYQNTVTDWAPLSSSIYLKIQLEDLSDTCIRDLLDDAGENDPEEVIAWLKTIVARLKPYQCYKTHNLSVTNELFSGDKIRLYSGKTELLIPREYMGNRHLFNESEVGSVFNGNRLAVFDEVKIDRIHRLDTDPKRWFVTTKVDSVTDKHVFRLTHRHTAHAPGHYYAMSIVADSKAMAGRPFYVKELMVKAFEELGKIHSVSEYHLEINPSAIDFVWDNKTVSIDTYRDNQSKYPASVDKQPVLIYPELTVVERFHLHHHGYSYTITEVTEIEEKPTDEKSSKGTKGPR